MKLLLPHVFFILILQIVNGHFARGRSHGLLIKGRDSSLHHRACRLTTMELHPQWYLSISILSTIFCNMIKASEITHLVHWMQCVWSLELINSLVWILFALCLLLLQSLWNIILHLEFILLRFLPYYHFFLLFLQLYQKNGSYSNHIISVYEPSALPFVFVLCHWCC